MEYDYTIVEEKVLNTRYERKDIVRNLADVFDL